jgi:hypothetical protein
VIDEFDHRSRGYRFEIVNFVNFAAAERLESISEGCTG